MNKLPLWAVYAVAVVVAAAGAVGSYWAHIAAHWIMAQ